MPSVLDSDNKSAVETVPRDGLKADLNLALKDQSG